MTPERHQPKRPYEIFGISEEEVTRWRVLDEKLKEILANPNTTVHEIKLSSNNYGDFIFLTASQGIGDQRICMTFWGLGFHEFRERWITKEWFWHQTHTSFVETENKLSTDEVDEKLKQRLEEIIPHLEKDTQTKTGWLFEMIADLTDDDAALTEMQDLGLL